MTHIFTPEFLDWVADRFVHVDGESPNVDFVLRLREEADKARLFTEELAKNANFYELVKLDGPHMDGTYTYILQRSEGPGGFGVHMFLLEDAADDLARQLDAAVQLATDLATGEKSTA